MLKQLCWMCGKEIPETEYDGQTRRFCEECYQKHSDNYKPIVAEYILAKNRVTFERALRIMEKASCDMTRYKKFAMAVGKHSQENPEQYRSADEMIAAIVLLEAGYDIQMNFKVGHYIVDVLIKELKVCFEVDGERHKHKKAEDGKRDVDIRAKLGKEWEVIRIPTKYIEEYPEQIPEAIIALYNQKKEIRAKNNGLLPESYSSRERNYYGLNTLYETRKTRVI